MNKKIIIILVAGIFFPITIIVAQVQVVSDGTFRVGADNYDPGDRDFTIMDVQHSTASAADAYTSFRMDNVNNYIQLNRKFHNYRNEIIWYSNLQDFWHMGMNDSDNTPGTYTNCFFR